MQIIIPKGRMTQGFGKNANSSYKDSGLKGHTAWDFVNGWKSDIVAVVDGEVYSTLNLHNKNTEKYRAVYQIVDEKYFSYEVSYGHIDKSYAKKGDFVRQGEPIATEGNWGLCYKNGIRVTPEQKKNGDGSHLHGPQIRQCKRVDKRERGKKYLRHSGGYLKRNGFYYEVVNYDNGYNGCLDPSLFLPLTTQQIINFIFALKKIGLLK